MKKKLIAIGMAVVLVLTLGGGVALAAIGDIKEGTPITPADPNVTGNGRAVAYDDDGNLYYTVTGDSNIYKLTTAGMNLGPIPDPGRTFTCGALSWDGTVLWAGTYDGYGVNSTGDYVANSADVWTIDPVTGVATWQFNTYEAFGGFADDTCGGSLTGYMDGLAVDEDGTLWLSADLGRTIYHVQATGASIASYPTPTRPTSTGCGCNAGIEVAPGGYLELALMGAPYDPEGSNDHYLVKVAKTDPSGSLIVDFIVNNPEDLAYDADTYKPRAVIWINSWGASNNLTAYDVQVTRTLGYWKNHSDDAMEFLPITLGDNDQDGVCKNVTTAAEVKTIMKAAKAKDTADMLYAQLLAAKLNVAMGDIPPADLAAIGPVIDAADELLGRNGCNPDTGRKGTDRAEATALISELDAFNNKYSP